MDAKRCTNCRRSRAINGAMHCEESRSSAIGGVIVVDLEEAKRVGTLDRLCMLVGARCAFYQTIS